MHQTTKYFTLVLTAAVATAGITGCSGSRVRNLVSGSDYLTLEEIQAKDEAARTRSEEVVRGLLADAGQEPTDKPGAEVLVSQATTDVEPAGEGFSLSRFFGRKSNTGLTPDPFAEGPDEELAEQGTDAIPVAATKIVDPASSEVSLEDQVEEMFKAAAKDTVDETGRQLSDAIAEANPFADDVADTASFGELMAQQENLQEDTQQVTQDATNAFAAIEAGAQAAVRTPADEFDAILGVETPNSDTALDSELFPESGEFLAEPAVVDGTPAAIFGDLTGSSEAPVQAQPEDRHVADVFELASEKHGFGKLQPRDPWAGADEPDFGEPVPQPNDAIPFSSQSVWSGEDAFTATPVDEAASEEFDEFAFDWDEPDASDPGEFVEVQPHFQQVSSSEVTEGFPVQGEGLNVTEPMLVIPGSTGETFSVPVPVPANGDGSGLRDTSVKVEAAPGHLPAEGTEVAGSADSGQGARGASVGPRSGNRSWLFAVGCLLIAALLFLPERQNRANQ